MKALTSPASSAVLPPSGTLLRVIASTTMAVSAMSAATATIGLLLLTFTTPAACASAAVAASVRRTATVARAGYRSVVSKSSTKSLSFSEESK